MGLAAEMKDFNAGVQNANKFWDQRADQKLKEAKAADYDRQHQPITDEERANMPGMGGSVGSGLIAPPSSGVPSDLDQNQVFGGFMDTVQQGYGDPNHRVAGVTNPYGLAAIAATGSRESGYDPGNVNRTWDDGGKPSGGIMSWRDDRLAKLQKFNGGGNGTPQQQAQFFLQENPDLITKLNNAKSTEEATALMNGAWSYAGYDPKNPIGDPEGKARYAAANGFYDKYKDKWGAGPTATASGAPSTGTSANAGAIPADETPSDDGEGTEGEGDSQDTDDDGTEESKADTQQPVQTAAAAPVIPVPTQVASAAPVQQFAPVQNSGFSSQQPSQQIQPSQQPQAVQPRGMSAGTGVSRVADAILSKEEQAKQAAIQKGALFAKDGGVIPPNFGTPTINQYYARGGTVPKVEHQGTSEWLYDHLPSWLTGEEMGDTIRQTERGIGRPSIPERGQKEDMPREPIKTDRRQQASMDMTSGPREPPPGKDQPPAPIDTSRRQQESMDMTSGPREPPQVPAPPQTVSQQVSAGAQPVIPERGQKEPTTPPVIPPEQPHTMSRALRPDEQAAPTATAPTQGPPAPPPQTVAQRVSAQASPVIPERGQKEDAPPTPAPMQGPHQPDEPGAPPVAPVTPGAARASSEPMPLGDDDYDPLAAWKDAGDLSSYDRRSSRFDGQAVQTPASREPIVPGERGAIPVPEKQGPPAPPRDVVTPYRDPNAEDTPYVSAQDHQITPDEAGAEPTQDEIRNAPEKQGPPAPPPQTVAQRVSAAASNAPAPAPRQDTPSPDLVPNQATGENRPAEPGEVAGAIPVPGARPANPINGDVPIPQDRPDRPTRPVATAAAAPAPDIATRRASPASGSHPQPAAQPAPAGGQGRMLNAGSQSPRINAGSTAAQVRDSKPANPRYTASRGYSAPQPHSNPRTVAVAAVGVHHGLDFLRHIFGFDGSSNDGAIPNGQHNPAGARKFISGYGATDKATNDKIDATLGVDPNLSEGNKLLDRMSRTTQVYLSKGMAKEAKAAAGSQLQFAATQFGRIGSLAQESYQKYLQTGDARELQHTLDFMTKAHEMIPDGSTFGVYVDPQSHKITATRTDAEGHEEHYAVTAQELPGIINGIKDKSTFWREVESIADPAAARARLNREASDQRSANSQNRQDQRQDERLANTNKNLAETRAREDKKLADKAAADAAKLKNKQVDSAKVMPLVNTFKAAKKAYDASGGDDSHDLDVAASELYDAIPDGMGGTKKDDYFWNQTGSKIADFNYVPPDQRGAPAAPAEGDAAPAEGGSPINWSTGEVGPIDWKTGNVGAAPTSKPAAGTAKFTPPPGAQFDKKKGKYIAKMPNGQWGVVAGQ